MADLVDARDLIPPPLPPVFFESQDSDTDDDIYRGPRDRLPSLVPSLESSPSSPSLSSSSSSSSSGLPGPIGAIASAVERAISRWARVNGSTSSLSSSDTDSSTSSLRSASRAFPRRKRPLSTSGIFSELDVAARIRAREERLHIPREFALYMPPPVSPSRAPMATSSLGPEGLLRTTSLQLVASHLMVALRKPAKPRRARRRPRATPYLDNVVSATPLPLEQMTASDQPASAPTPAAHRKGKRREDLGRMLPSGTAGVGEAIAQKAWWLDVASPTWEDVRHIGKLLRLHPLTLEDILQQEPREKLELFPSLGYYFTVFRAIKARSTKHSASKAPAVPVITNTVDEVYVYLVVFQQGICTFHFADISEHIEHVRSKIFDLNNTFTMSSAWVAHGILDSIVDSFFPILDHIEAEAADMVFNESLNESTPTISTAQNAAQSAENSQAPIESDYEKHPPTEKTDSSSSQALNDTVPLRQGSGSSIVKSRAHFVLQTRAPAFIFHRFKQSILPFSRTLKARLRATETGKIVAPNPTTENLRRVAHTRRLVTTLGRVLSTKGEVVGRLRKRLLTPGEHGMIGQDDVEVAIYMGDVQDHILSLQHSLAHYERVLSQSHQTYLQHLRTVISRGRSNQDIAILLLSVVTIGVLPCQVVIGMFSMNVTVPHNPIPDGPYYWFGIVLTLCGVVMALYIYIVYRWWRGAKCRPKRSALM